LVRIIVNKQFIDNAIIVYFKHSFPILERQGIHRSYRSYFYKFIVKFFKGLAFLFSAVLIIGIHLFVVLLEEPYLESVLEDEYHLYKSKTPRYIGIPRNKSSTNSY